MKVYTSEELALKSEDCDLDGLDDKLTPIVGRILLELYLEQREAKSGEIN